MAVVDAVSLLEHVLCLRSLGVIGAKVVNVRLDIGEEVGSVTGLLEGATQAVEVASVGGELIAEQREVVLLDARVGECRFGVEKPC